MAVKYVIGIDEVGRGPLAGPVAVGMVAMEVGEYEKLKESGIFPVGKDSKKLSAKRRELYLTQIESLKTNGQLRFGIFFEDNKVIDQNGIAVAIRFAIKKGLDRLGCEPAEVKLMLDGGLRPPKKYENWEAIIKGDESELIISLASIAAKVTRDHLMVRLAEEYPVYGLEKHKGYGTKAHMEAIKNSGISDIHRRSFLRHIDLK